MILLMCSVRQRRRAYGVAQIARQFANMRQLHIPVGCRLVVGHLFVIPGQVIRNIDRLSYASASTSTTWRTRIFEPRRRSPLSSCR
jgi:hypothetical protein